MTYREPDFITDEAAREVFIGLVQRGYTVRALRKQMSMAKVPISTDIPDAVIINWMRSVRVDLEQDRAEADKDFPFWYGMASAFERARRLIELAEELEPRTRVDLDAANMYRTLLAQIRQELEPFSLTIEPGDGWAELMERLINVRELEVDESNVETAPSRAGGDSRQDWDISLTSTT